MLKAEHLTKTYLGGKKTALDKFSLHVPKGSIYGLLGPNGAGKTTFIRIVNQILQPDKGTVYMDGEALSLAHISQIGYMPEERGLYKNMTVGDQLLYFGELKGLNKAEALSQAKYWFELLEIEQWWKKKLSELSKGMAQKIQFVVTVLHRPKLLILDEPFSGFDPVNANLIKDQIIRLKENGTTIILSTHRMESVEEMCDHVALINHSKKILDGTIAEVREKFKKNLYSVTLSESLPERFEQLKKDYAITEYTEKNGLIHFEMKNEGPPNLLLKTLMEVGNLKNFQEKIPSMNEVFIQAVSNHKS
ncbi:ABC transporter ATP-binding protein [Bergeyella sp. RCAD1439]|uniref:ABC transporter ATP-binding protein n=1 Tax=Bergeyella anatis TaxID=3113737 RepID=UPI002E192C73|nr:ATP-binding cassette domain-containing protein [Bergeyella sp. RCAD1439]